MGRLASHPSVVTALVYAVGWFILLQPLVAFAQTGGGRDSPLDKLGLIDPDTNLKAFLRARASIDPATESACWWTGTIYSRIPDERSKPLFLFEGFSVSRVIRDESGWKILSREGGIYRDPESGAILDNWLNPSTAETIAVPHLWNDPVNQDLSPSNPRGIPKLPFVQLDDRICWNVDVIMFFPSPVPKLLYPDASNTDQYSGMELFQFFASIRDLADPNRKSVPGEFTWTRIGPYLPWMKMGNQAGELVYHCRGMKLEGGAASFPEHIRKWILDRRPEFMHAPETFTTPNASSWTEYLKTLITPTPTPTPTDTPPVPDPALSSEVE